jgi:hypothetical protein
MHEADQVRIVIEDFVQELHSARAGALPGFLGG